MQGPLEVQRLLGGFRGCWGVQRVQGLLGVCKAGGGVPGRTLGTRGPQWGLGQVETEDGDGADEQRGGASGGEADTDGGQGTSAGEAGRQKEAGRAAAHRTTVSADRDPIVIFNCIRVGSQT